MNNQRKFQIGDIVQHFKRETLTSADDPNKYLYVIRGFAKHTETGEMLVIYQGLYSPFETYARPYDMFKSKVDKTKYPNINQEYRLEIQNTARWEYWDGWCGNHDKRIEDATCSKCGYKHPTVRGTPELLADYCPYCHSKMIKYSIG